MTSDRTSPIAVGGIGGSGTRLIAELLSELGVFIGGDLNKAYDNLWFTLLFKRREIISSTNAEFEQLVEIFSMGMLGGKDFSDAQIKRVNSLAAAGRIQHPPGWLKKRAASLLSSTRYVSTDSISWGWKEPNTHVVIDRLQQYLPNLKYIHVVRNGLDMAWSNNQNQLEYWGSALVGNSCRRSPYYALKYWCAVHRRVLEMCQSMGSRFLFLDYDALCRNPAEGIRCLTDFVGMDLTELRVKRLAKTVKPSQRIGASKRYPSEIFDRADIEFVKKLGFEIRAPR